MPLRKHLGRGLTELIENMVPPTRTSNPAKLKLRQAVAKKGDLPLPLAHKALFGDHVWYRPARLKIHVKILQGSVHIMQRNNWQEWSSQTPLKSGPEPILNHFETRLKPVWNSSEIIVRVWHPPETNKNWNPVWNHPKNSKGLKNLGKPCWNRSRTSECLKPSETPFAPVFKGKSSQETVPTLLRKIHQRKIPQFLALAVRIAAESCSRASALFESGVENQA